VTWSRSTYLLSLVAFPLRAMGWVLGELPRTVVGWERISNVLDERGEMPYGRPVADAGARSRSTCDDVDYAYQDDDGAGTRCCTTSASIWRRAGRWPIVGPTGAGKTRWPPCWSGWSTRPAAGSC
jgi:ABC-type multidrug transport system fused ATPase/permease subunit